MYWNKSIQRINMITSNEYEKKPLTTIEKFPKGQLWGGSVFSKELISHFDMKVFPRVVWILFWNFSRNISVDKNLLYGKLSKYLSIYLLESCILYSAVNFFRYFQQILWWFPLQWVINIVFTNIMNNSDQLR